VIIFTHIPRTAGTSLRLVIERNYKPERILQVYGDAIPRAAEFVAAQNLNNIQVVRGHIGFGVHEVLPEGEHEYITLLRHPYDRLVSLYRYILRDKGHFAHRQVVDMPFRKFVSSGVTAETDNGMVRQLCGIEEYQQKPYADYKVPFGTCGPEQLELALKNLEEHYTIVGIQERFGKFLDACRQRYEWRIPKSPPHANSTTRMQDPTPSGKVVRSVMTFNMYDLLLWDYARQRAAP